MNTYPLARKNKPTSQKHQRPLNPPPQQRHHRQQLQQNVNVALVVGHAPWWIPTLPASNGRSNRNSNIYNDTDFGNGLATDGGGIKRNTTFAEALRDFLQNFSFHCYGKLVETGRRYQEKMFWFLFHVAALLILIMFLLNYNDNGERLLTTSIYDPAYPIKKVPFPAVSICSINRISKTSATRYAEELNDKDPKKRGVAYFYERIKLLDYNYYTTNDVANNEDIMMFQRFLDTHDLDDNELFYNTRRKMAMLTPNCSHILLKCRLAGKEIECNREFRETFTSKGLCCTFNFNRKYAKQREFEHRFFGQDMGLMLLLNASHNDDLFETSALDSYSINVHSSFIHSDHSSGSVEQRFIKNGTDSFISLTPSIFQTVDEARFLKPKVRNCLYRNEMPSLFGEAYTFSNCITHCRHRSIMVLCQCVMFTVPHDFLPPLNDTEYCSLQHRECLNRYDFKWFNVITQRQNMRGLERENEDALYCPDCLPSCSEIRHRVAIMSLPLNKYNIKIFQPRIRNFTDLAIARIYFGETHVKFYRSFLLNSWFEVFSHVGNICSVIAGFSLIGICEIIFFFVKYFYTSIKHETLVENSKESMGKPMEALIILP